MTEPNEDAPGVHRLVDMVVEEVSLVDRAANLHRFLVVKRDQPMSNTTPASGDAAKPTQKVDAGVLAVATAALESITRAVERLGELGDEDGSAMVAELVEELTELASELAAAAGIEFEPAQKGADPTTIVADVRDALGKVAAMLEAAKNAADGDSAPEAQAPATASDPPAADRVSAELAAVASTLRTLTEAVKEQGQRLGRLEKGIGLPNSRSAPERPARTDADDASWPLDLNKPLDRASVDKSVSFHDR